MFVARVRVWINKQAVINSWAARPCLSRNKELFPNTTLHKQKRPIIFVYDVKSISTNYNGQRQSPVEVTFREYFGRQITRTWRLSLGKMSLLKPKPYNLLSTNKCTRFLYICPSICLVPLGPSGLVLIRYFKHFLLPDSGFCILNSTIVLRQNTLFYTEYICAAEPTI